MASYMDGKTNIVFQLKNSLKKGISCLDAGPCDGVWGWLLGDYFEMDACEIFYPYIENYRLTKIYNHVFNHDIRDFKYCWYDIVLFGDIIEHLSVEDAQMVLDYALNHSAGIMVAVPYRYEQEAINGNENEVHLQPDLTPEIFDERYSGFIKLWYSDN